MLPWAMSLATLNPSRSPEATARTQKLCAPHQERGRLLPEVVAQLALELSAGPFDPNAQLPGRDGGTVPLLQWVVERLPVSDGDTVVPAQEKSAAAARAWPVDVAGFEKDLERLGPPSARPEVDARWLVALLLACGADPWSDRTSTVQWGPCLDIAMAEGEAGLVERWMGLPGAPSWAELGAGRYGPAFTFPVARGVRPSHWWGAATSAPAMGPVLDLLLAKRAACPPDFDPLKQSCEQALAPLLQHEPDLREQKDRASRIQAAWFVRLRMGNLDPTTFANMTIALAHHMGKTPLDPVASKQAKARLIRQAQAYQDLNQLEWGPRPAPFATQGRRPAAAWNERVELRMTTAQGGTWSELAIVWLRTIQALSSATPTLPAWRLTEWLEPAAAVGEKEKEKEKEGPPAGTLAEAIGFDWRPGIAIDGIALLALYGAPLRGHDRRANARVLGIEDLPSWVARTLPAAIAFTQTHLRDLKNDEKHILNKEQAFAHLWTQVIKTLPPAVCHNVLSRPEAGLGLIQAFHAGFEGMGSRGAVLTPASSDDPIDTTQRWQDPLATLAKRLWRQAVSPQAWAAERPSSPAWQPVWLELRLLEGNANAVLECLRSAEALSPPETARIELWLAQRRKESEAMALHVRSPRLAELAHVAKALNEHRLRHAWQTAPPLARSSRL